MKTGRPHFIFSAAGRFFAVGLAGFLALVVRDRAGENSITNIQNFQSTRFTSDQYFDPPHQQQLKLRLSGASASPLPGGAQDIRDLKIERYDVAGKLQVVVRAPQCTYALLDGVVYSGGPIELETGDGKMRTEAVGFLWRQDDNSLTLSNQVHSVFHTGILKLSIP